MHLCQAACVTSCLPIAKHQSARSRLLRHRGRRGGGVFTGPVTIATAAAAAPMRLHHRDIGCLTATLLLVTAGCIEQIRHSIEGSVWVYRQQQFFCRYVPLLWDHHFTV